MIELVFVIIILGILASLAMERMDRDLTQEASESVLSSIRLTQQQALIDNKHRKDNNPNWQRAYWRFDFNCTSACAYNVGSDINLNGTIEKAESAIDPIDGKYLWNDGTGNDMSNRVLLGKKFGVINIEASDGCDGSSSIAFDFLGRPHLDVSTATNNFSSIMRENCKLTFDMSSDDNFSIIIESETGHTSILGQP